MRAVRGWVLFSLLLSALVSGLAAAQGTVSLTAWTAGPDDAFKVYGSALSNAVAGTNQALDDEMYGVHVGVDVSLDAGDQTAYLERVGKALEAGKAPQIIQVPASKIPVWAAAGYLAPLDRYISMNSRFNDVVPGLWDAVTYQGHRYGTPLYADVRGLYYNKVLLAKLGWTDQQIAALPGELASGQFTWEDVLNAAGQAVDKGVVAKGHGFMHEPVKGPDLLAQYMAFGGDAFDASTGTLVLDESALLRYFTWLKTAEDRGIAPTNALDGNWSRYNQAVTQGDGTVLFFTGDSSLWRDWSTRSVADRGGSAWLSSHLGFGPQPAWEKGGTPVSLSEPEAYVMPSGASAREQDLGARLIARATVPEVEAKSASATGRLPVLTSTTDALSDPFLKAASGLLKSARFQPPVADFTAWSSPVYQGVVDVEQGKTSPTEAVDEVVAAMKRQLAGNVEIHAP